MADGLMARLSATGRRSSTTISGQSVPRQWQKHMARVGRTSAKGIRAYPLCSPNTTTQIFNMSNTRPPRLAARASVLESDAEKPLCRWQCRASC
jgi:hypothetical protein